MIEFEPDIPNVRLLRKAVRWAKRNRDHMPYLSALAPRQSVDEVMKLAKSWQALGLGSVREVSADGKRSVIFSLNEEALAKVSAADRSTFTGRLTSVSRSDWIALGALLTSLVALFK